MAKKAVLIGCNYPGTEAELKGCVNDVRRMYGCLVELYGFAEEDITVLIDTDDSYSQPTGQNICAALADLVISAAPGDSLFVQYSGHGTRIPTENDDDNTGYDECIVPTDMNLVTDDTFRELVDNVPKGCRITIVSDSCHSGGLIDAAKEQIGNSTAKKKVQPVNDNESISETENVEDTIESQGVDIISKLHISHHPKTGFITKDKSLPLPILMEILNQKTGKTDITDASKLREALFSIFGEDATPKIKNFMTAVWSKLQKTSLFGAGAVLGLVGGLALDYIGGKPNQENGNSSPSDNGILISGCQTYETSADVRPLDDVDLAYGALTGAILKIIEQTSGKVSNRELVRKTRMLLMRDGFSQRPGLYCCDDHVDDPFICSI